MKNLGLFYITSDFDREHLTPGRVEIFKTGNILCDRDWATEIAGLDNEGTVWCVKDAHCVGKKCYGLVLSRQRE